MNLPPERHKIQYTHGLSTPYAVHTVQVMRYFPLTGGKVPREQNNVKINWFATKLYFDYLFVKIHNNVSVPWRFSLPAACWCVFANRNDRDLRRFKNRFRLNAQTNVKELRNNNWIIIASSRASSGWKRDGGRRKKNNVRNHQSFPPDTALCVDDFAPRVHWPTRIVVHFIAYRDGWIHPFSLCLPRILSKPLAHCPPLPSPRQSIETREQNVFSVATRVLLRCTCTVKQFLLFTRLSVHPIDVLVEIII